MPPSDLCAATRPPVVKGNTMAKIGTAHIEVKPVLNEEALAAIGRQIEQTVRAAVAAGLTPAPRSFSEILSDALASPPGD